MFLATVEVISGLFMTERPAVRVHRLWHLPARKQAHQSRENEQKCATRAGVRGKGEFEARGAPWRAPRDAGRGRPTPRGARDAKSTARPSAARSAARRRAAADAT